MLKKQILVNGNIITYLISDNFDPLHTTLFMHGRGQDKHSFDHIFKLFESQNRSFVSIDLPGFGESAKPQADWEIKDYAECIKDFADKLGLKDINLVSHSFGGRISIYITAHKLIKINKQVLIASGGIKPKQNNSRLMIMKNLKKILLGLGLKNIHDKMQKKFRSIDYQNAKDMDKIFLNTINYDLTPSLSKIKTPTKLIRGTLDDQTPLQDGMLMNQEIKNSQIYIIQGGNHFIHIENYKTVFEQIDDFLFNQSRQCL